jgi:tRNA(adenine34) deaminase
MIEDDHQYYFGLAMIEARRAFERGFSPVGAVLVCDRQVILGAASRRKIGNILHAEYILFQNYQENGLSPKGELSLYSTLEPCIMCAGMAAVLKINHIAWLVDDIWAGASRVYNPENNYIKTRFPKMAKVDIPHLYQEALSLWIQYLKRTGHPDAVRFMLGIE